LHDLYLIVEVPEGMLVLDQHALHERILYEQLKARRAAGDLEQQRLLIPEPIDLPAHQVTLVLGRRADLAGLGLEVEGFGGSTVLLHSYPVVLGKRTPQAIFRAVVDYLIAKEKLPAREEMLNDLLSLMACHAAVRAGDRLTPEEIAGLVRQRDRADHSQHCPHGRPCSRCTTSNASSAVSEARFRSSSSREPAGLGARRSSADAARVRHAQQHRQGGRRSVAAPRLAAGAMPHACEQARQTLAGLLRQVGPADMKPAQ
jgi:DNA mismatch repair ATPase MutL